MSIVKWDPWRELEEVRAQTNLLWDRFLSKLGAEAIGVPTIEFLPDTDVVETQFDFRIYMSVPGLVEEDIEIEVSSVALTVRGERHPPYDTKRRHVKEWRYGHFERKLTVDEPIDIDRVVASYEDGVLCIVLPKQNPQDGEVAAQ